MIPENTFICVSRINRLGICEVKDEIKIPENIGKDSQFTLTTSFDEDIIIKNNKIYTLEIENVERKVWIGKVKLKPQPSEKTNKIPRVDIVYGRCVDSMALLDPIYRNYVTNRHKFKSRTIAIKAVAGGGKTTLLLKLADNHKNQNKSTTKKILYLAFNRQIVQEIKHKCRKNGLSNLIPMTFDALVREMAIKKMSSESSNTTSNHQMYSEQDLDDMMLMGDSTSNQSNLNIIDLSPYTLTSLYPWFKGKSFKVKKSLIHKLSLFCRNPRVKEICQMFPTNTMLNQLWKDIASKKLVTFDGLRKLASLHHWMKDYIDSKYDMIFIDEAQDFDPVMLDMLLKDTTIPKIFVGDPKQQIYEWRGSINSFGQLPENTLIFEFYSTFRIGNPACKQIREITKTWMIPHESCCDKITEMNMNTPPPPDLKYTYIFRTWRALLLKAQKMKNIWIYDFDKKMVAIERLHSRILKYPLTPEDMLEFEDDLPAFLMKLNANDLCQLKSNIEQNMIPQHHAQCCMYTIHSYKGMETECLRVHGDIDIKNEPNLYYVALTRGMKFIFTEPLDDIQGNNNMACQSNRKKQQTIPSNDEIYNKELFEKLKFLRSNFVKETGKPAFSIYTNQVMLEIAKHCPQTPKELLNVRGIGEKKLTIFGDDILKVCRSSQ